MSSSFKDQASLANRQVGAERTPFVYLTQILGLIGTAENFFQERNDMVDEVCALFAMEW